MAKPSRGKSISSSNSRLFGLGWLKPMVLGLAVCQANIYLDLIHDRTQVY